MESTWFESRGRAWHEGKKDLLESWTVFVAQSEEREAGDGLFLKRRVNLNDAKLVSSFKSEFPLVTGNSRKLGGLLLWPGETEGRGELRFLDPFLVGGDGILVGGDGGHEHRREGGGASLCFWAGQGFTKRVASGRGYLGNNVSKLICRTCSLTTLSHTGGAIASHLDIR